MRLLLFRHGPAADRLAWRGRGRADALRPLTRDGVGRTRAAARGIASLIDVPGAVATSPLVRAVETAGELCAAFAGGRGRARQGMAGAPPEPEELPALAPDAEPAALLPWLRARSGLDLVAVVGHEPHLGRLASFLLAGEGADFIGLKKAGACLIDLGDRPGPGTARLLWLLAPSQLRRLGRSQR